MISIRSGKRFAVGGLLAAGIMAMIVLHAGSEPTLVHPAGATDALIGLLELGAAPPRPIPISVEHGALDRGDTLSAALGRLGFDGADRASALAVLGRSINPRRLPARTGLTLAREGGAIRSLSLRADPARFVRLTAQVSEPAGWTADWVELPVLTQIEQAGGVVSRSVGQALSDSANGLGLTLAFADIFQWDVDLLVDPRPGDVVRVVYELRRLGETPVDLPRFGDVASSPGDELGLGRILAAEYEGSVARSVAFWIEGEGLAGSYYDSDGRPMRKSFLKSPLNYRRISSRFSSARRNPVTRKVVPHHGVDFAASAGTPVVATADGKVISSGWAGALGRAVKLRHGSEYVTVYGHLQSTARGIRPGVQVEQNQVIGYVGSTGRATGPHLHYTMIHGGRPINPLKFTSPSLEPLPEALRPSLERAKSRFLPKLREFNVTAPATATSNRKRQDG